ncbi:uncharacterized protein LOC123534925 [Mercenaria mercenaria]|uniref:uncharacterized protein LOC123534925 n=1 Tax=Mercenaria mercenaria TaxID=6596 RepID=UPI00234F1EE3|nr:uncharacterized protein LOC123534925 [Mercenaria mercenaria]
MFGIHILVSMILIGSVQFIRSTGNQIGCGIVEIGNEYFESCRNELYLEDIFTDFEQGRDGEIRPTAFLEQLYSTCSNYESYMKCANCTAKRVCEDEETKLKELLSERWALFCDGDQPSDWLKIILQNQYSYNMSCDHVFKKSFLACVQRYQTADTNATSLTDVSEVAREAVSGIFKCVIGELLSHMDYVRQCGSSWQDILLTGWLKISASYGLAFRINENEVEQLKMMRCQ